jgi:hypothetical protein
MDTHTRYMIVFCILAAFALAAIAIAPGQIKKRRADRLRRRGIKSYNRSAKVAKPRGW